MAHLSSSLVVLLLVAITHVQVTAGGMTLSLRLDRYNNAEGDGANGNCCDGRSIFCSGQCDHFFIICLDVPYSMNYDIDHCPLGRHITGVTDNRNVIRFGSSIGGGSGNTANPHSFNIQTWPGGVFMKVQVNDDDSRTDDLVENLQSTISLPADGIARAATISGRTRLEVRMTATCSEDYYGTDCNTHCIAPVADSHYTCDTSTGARDCEQGWYGTLCGNPCAAPMADSHYTCDTETGAKVCQEGWYGISCTTQCLMDDDSHHTCHPETGDRICHDGWEGDECDERRHPCAHSPCVNRARCIGHTGNNTYTCECRDKFLGVNCERSEQCSDNPCHGPSQCYSTRGTYHCFCDDGWTGERCETVVDVCEELEPCENSARCVEDRNATHADYRCLCQRGWRGKDCHMDINECDDITCPGSRECHNSPGSYECSCANNGIGDNCEPPTTAPQTTSSPCASSPCMGDATCTSDGVSSFRCQCPSGYTGPMCESTVDYCSSTPCAHGQPCVSGVSGFTCHCSTMYSGVTCSDIVVVIVTPATPCSGAGCEGTKRASLTEQPVTEVAGGTTGRPIANACSVNPCQNGGNCLLPADGANIVCACAEGYSGPFCGNYNDDKPQTLYGVSYELIKSMDVLTRGMSKTASRYLGVAQGDITINIDLFKCKEYRYRETKRVLYVQVTVENKGITGDALRAILQETTGDTQLDILEGNATATCVPASGPPNTGASTQEGSSSSILFVVILLTVVAMITLLVAGTWIVYKRKQKKNNTPEALQDVVPEDEGSDDALPPLPPRPQEQTHCDMVDEQGEMQDDFIPQCYVNLIYDSKAHASKVATITYNTPPEHEPLNDDIPQKHPHLSYHGGL